MDLLDLLQEQLEEVLSDDADVFERRLEVGDQRVEERGQVGDQLEVGDRVEQDQPADNEQPGVRVRGIDPLLQERDELRERERLGRLHVVVLQIVAGLVLHRRVLDLGLVEAEHGDVVCGLVAHNVLDEPVQDVCAVLDAVLHVGNQLAENVEDLVEVHQDLALGDLGDVVQRLAGVVPDVRVVVAKAGDDRMDDAVEILGELVRA